MARQTQAGFTLIEIMLVMAISGMLLVIAFAGQRGIRSRTQFDAAVNKVVSIIANARGEATAGVNVAGSGDGTDKCSGGTNAGDRAGERYVFAGTSLTANALSPQPLKMDYYKAKSGDTACRFIMDQAIDLHGDLSISANFVDYTTSPPTVGASIPGGVRVLYVRTDAGDLAVCSLTLTGDEVPAFRDGRCALPAAPITGTASLRLTLSDADGHISHVDIAPSGLARRVD